MGAVLLLLAAHEAGAEARFGHCYAGPGFTCLDESPVDADGVLRPGLHVYFGDPTNRYPHAVLGDDLEWGSLHMVQQGSPAHGPYAWDSLELPGTRVFEDLTPRIGDLDGDGGLEIVVIESDARQGARLVVFGLDAEFRLVRLAQTPFIGQRFRWRAPFAIGDLDGDGLVEIAEVDRPHLAKILRIWRYRDRELEQVVELPGFSAHRIGEDFISGGIRDCGDGPELVVPSARWSELMSVRLRGSDLVVREVAQFGGFADLDRAMTCE